ncbi:MAG: hypothetical protein K1060chlam1_00650 [Candidatus Anoxychlamydiales bacterium]|nr:hypothetical protein [Candidatus Anoxychlamydiales bacterium]
MAGVSSVLGKNPQTIPRNYTDKVGGITFGALAAIGLIAVGILTGNPFLILGGVVTGVITIYSGYRTYSEIKKEEQEKQQKKPIESSSK